MLNDAAIKAKPTKYAQNNGQGMYDGTPIARDFAPDRCSAPNTARGMAKHRLLKATILSRPRARATSFFVAGSPRARITRPALHIKTAGRKNSKKRARRTGCIELSNQNSA